MNVHKPANSTEGEELLLPMAVSHNSMTRALLEGRVLPKGLTLIPSALHGSEMFWRQLRYAEFDVSDMSMSSLSISYSHGVKDWIAIPVYTMRRFFHTQPRVRKDRNIKEPKDLKGKRMAVAEYQQTAAIWSRGILQDEFGVHPKDIEWWMERGADKSHGHATGFKAPPGVTVNFIPPDTNIGEMLVKGELDATLNYLTDPNLVDRSRIDLDNHPDIEFLFRDPGAECRRYYAKTKIYPINHTIVIRRSLYEKHPWIAKSIYDAFCASAEIGRQNANAFLAPFAETGTIDSKTAEILQSPVMPYGIKQARHVLETVTRYVHEQGLCDRQIALEEIFVPELLNT